MTLESQAKSALGAYELAITASPSVTRCDLVSGPTDYFVTVLSRSLGHLAEIHRKELLQLPGVVRMESSVVLREVVKQRLPPGMEH